MDSWTVLLKQTQQSFNLHVHNKHVCAMGNVGGVGGGGGVKFEYVRRERGRRAAWVQRKLTRNWAGIQSPHR